MTPGSAVGKSVKSSKQMYVPAGVNETDPESPVNTVLPQATAIGIKAKDVRAFFGRSQVTDLTDLSVIAAAGVTPHTGR